MPKRKHPAYSGILATPIKPSLTDILVPPEQSPNIQRETNRRVDALYGHFGLEKGIHSYYDLLVALAQEHVPGFKIEPLVSIHRKRSGPEALYRMGESGVRLWALVQHYGKNRPLRAGKINIAEAISAVVRKHTDEFGHYRGKEKSLRKNYENAIKHNHFLKWFRKRAIEQGWTEEELIAEILVKVPYKKSANNSSE